MQHWAAFSTFSRLECKHANVGYLAIAYKVSYLYNVTDSVSVFALLWEELCFSNHQTTYHHNDFEAAV